MNQVESKKFIELFQILIDNLRIESDRGVVLVVTTMVEVELNRCIEKRLIPALKPKRDVVSRSLKNFAAKIDLAYRIGVITEHEHRVYHQLRELRNVCAHEIDEQNFDKPLFQESMKNIINSSDFLWDTLASKLLNPSSGEKFSSPEEMVNGLGWRISFEMFFSLIIAHKRVALARVRPVIPLHQSSVSL